MILYRPVSLQELELIYDSGMKSFPARLPKQPIFYPVLELEYARQTASDWNIKHGKLAGYVTEFKVEDPYIGKFKKHKVGGSQYQELWIPTEEVEEFNHHIVGHIKVLEGYFGKAFEGFVPDKFALQGKNAVEQFTLLANSYLYKRMDFYLEIKRNHKAIFLNYPFWQTYEFKNPGLKEKIMQAIKDAWLSSFPKIPLPVLPPVLENMPSIKQVRAQKPANPVREANPSVEQADLDEQSSTDPVYEDITLVEQTDPDDLIQEEPLPVKQNRTPLQINPIQEDIPHVEPTRPVVPVFVSPIDKDVAPTNQTQAYAELSADLGDEDSDSWEDFEGDVIAPAKEIAPSVMMTPVREEIPSIEETDPLTDLDEEDSSSKEETGSDSFDDLMEDDISSEEEETESDSIPNLADEKFPHREQIASPRFKGPVLKEDSSPYQINSHFVQGVKLGLQENYSEAIEELSRAIEEDPDHGAAHTSLGVVYHCLREDDRAVACYETALQIDPHDAEAHYFRANILYNHGYVREAIEGYTIAIGLEPELIQAPEAPPPQDRLTDYIPAPAGAHGIARLAQRIIGLNKSLERNPGQAHLFKERAATYARLWNYEQAIADYSSSLALQPEDARALHSRGLAYEQIGQSEQALEDYQRAVAINPQLSDVYIHRGITLGKMRNFRQSIASLSEGIRLAPGNPNGYFNRGVSYFQQGDFLSAIDDFSRVIRLAPNYESAYHWRGVAHEQVGRQREAIADYRQFLEISQDPRARAEIEQRLNRSNEGKKNGLSIRRFVQDAMQKMNQGAPEEPDQNFDLHDLIAALGERALHSTWFGNGVNCYGEKAEELYALTNQNKPIQGPDLLAIASGISQTIQGDFTAFDQGANSHWILIRAWKGSGFYIEINDRHNKQQLKTRFPSMEEVEGAHSPYEGLFIRKNRGVKFHFLGG